MTTDVSKVVAEVIIRPIGSGQTQISKTVLEVIIKPQGAPPAPTGGSTQLSINYIRRLK